MRRRPDFRPAGDWSGERARRSPWGAAAAVVLVALIVFAGNDGGRRQQPAGVQAPPPTTSGDSAPEEALPKTPKIAVTEEGVSFSFRVPSAGWERFSSISTDKSAGGPISINKSIVGPQGAEAIIYWTSFPQGDYADPCVRLLSPSIGASAAKLAPVC